MSPNYYRVRIVLKIIIAIWLEVNEGDSKGLLSEIQVIIELCDDSHLSGGMEEILLFADHVFDYLYEVP